MIDKKISIGSLITIGTIIVSAGIAYGVSSNKIENVEILNVGFEYPSDKTLRPIANLAPVISTKNSNKITSVLDNNGGENYLSEPELVVLRSMSAPLALLFIKKVLLVF